MRSSITHGERYQKHHNDFKIETDQDQIANLAEINLSPTTRRAFQQNTAKQIEHKNSSFKFNRDGVIERRAAIGLQLKNGITGNATTHAVFLKLNAPKGSTWTATEMWYEVQRLLSAALGTVSL